MINKRLNKAYDVILVSSYVKCGRNVTKIALEGMVYFILVSDNTFLQNKINLVA